MQRYEFSIRTRAGQLVKSIRILGRDQPDAERKLRQMYVDCEIIRRNVSNAEKPPAQSADIEDVLTLIVKHS